MKSLIINVNLPSSPYNCQFFTPVIWCLHTDEGSGFFRKKLMLVCPLTWGSLLPVSADVGAAGAAILELSSSYTCLNTESLTDSKQQLHNVPANVIIKRLIRPVEKKTYFWAGIICHIYQADLLVYHLEEQHQFILFKNTKKYIWFSTNILQTQFTWSKQFSRSQRQAHCKAGVG